MHLFKSLTIEQLGWSYRMGLIIDAVVVALAKPATNVSCHRPASTPATTCATNILTLVNINQQFYRYIN